MTLQVLTRTISPYDGPDLFLGLFSDSSRARGARDAYLASVSRNDPWRVQSYSTTNLESDVQLVRVQDLRAADANSAIAFLVTAYFEEQGQLTRRFLAGFSERQAAMEFAAEQERLPSQLAPNRCDVDEVVLNILR